MTLSYTLPRFCLNDLTHYHKIFVDITTQNRCTFGMCLYVLLFNDVKISEWSKFQMCTNHKSWFAVLLWSLNKGTYRIYLWFLSLILWCYTYNTKQLVWTYCLDYQNCRIWLLLQPFQLRSTENLTSNPEHVLILTIWMICLRLDSIRILNFHFLCY